MNINLRHAIIITLIILAVAIPPVVCYLIFVRGDGTSGQPDTSGQSTTVRDEVTENQNGTEPEYVILIDPGHGGYDPGKVSPDGIREKDINLAISTKLAQALKDRGYTVFLTRDSDVSLDNPDVSSKKTSDLRSRTDMAVKVKADLYISIHQNSYSAEYVHGAQVFYYSTSKDGKALAESIQKHLIEDADPDNSRSAKGNSAYLVLAESPCTAVIVECGFLSNNSECSRLCTDDYQKALSDAICNGIDDWLIR